MPSPCIATQVGGEEIGQAHLAQQPLRVESGGVDDTSDGREAPVSQSIKEGEKATLPLPQLLIEWANHTVERLLIQHVSFELARGRDRVMGTAAVP